jgi:hypothetical protein
MIRHALVTVAAAAALGLTAAAPALAAQPYPINFQNFSLSAADSTRSGTVLSDGSLVLASSGLSGPFDYLDPFADYFGDGADGSGAYEYGTWTSGVTELSFPFNELVA